MKHGEAVAEFSAALELGLPDYAVQVASNYLAVTGNLNALPFFVRETENHPKYREHDLAQSLLDAVEGSDESGPSVENFAQ